MASYFTFGPARSLCPVSASVSPGRALGFFVALVRRGASPAFSLDRDAPCRGRRLLVHVAFSARSSGWVRASLSFAAPRPLVPVLLAAAWLVGFPSRFRDARSDPFFPGSVWESLVCAFRSPGV